MARHASQRKVKAQTDSNLIDSGSPFYWHPKMFKALPINNLILRTGVRSGQGLFLIFACIGVAIYALIGYLGILMAMFVKANKTRKRGCLFSL